MSLNQLLHRFSWYLILLVSVGSPLVLGAVHWPVKLALIFCSAASLLAFTLVSYRKGFRIRADGVALVSVGLLALIAFQLAPLPASWVQYLSPSGMSLAEGARQLGFEVPYRLSVSPGETMEQWMILAAALCLYLVAFNSSYRDGTGNRYLLGVGIAAGLVALVTLAQGILQPDKVLGLYVPAGGLPPKGSFVSTLLNSNHAAGFLNLGFFVLLGQWHKAHLGQHKGILGFLALACLAASVAQLSRGGILSLLAGFAFLTLLNRFGARGPSRSTSTTVMATVIGVAVLVFVAVGYVAAFNVVLKQTQQVELIPVIEEEMKVQVWSMSRPLVQEYRMAGAGAGAFGTAFSPVNTLTSGVEWTSPENEFVQALVEIGTPATILALLLILVMMWRRGAFAKTVNYYREALVALAVLGVHNLADFSLRIPGVLFPMAIVAGALSGAFARDYSKRRRWRIKTASAYVLPVVTVLFLVLVTGGIRAMEISRDETYARLESIPALDLPLVEQQFRTAATEAVARYPADSHLFAILGRRMARMGHSEEAFRLYDHAEHLCPGCPAPKVGKAALYVDNQDYRAALRALRAVAEGLPAHRKSVYRAIDRMAVDDSVIVEEWGTNEDLIAHYIQHVRHSGRLDREEQLILSSLRIHGYEPFLLSRLGYLYVSLNLLDRADRVAGQLLGMFPDVKDGFVIQGRIYLKQGLLDDAVLMYEEARARATGDALVSISLETMGLMSRLRRWDRFETISGEIQSSAMKTPWFRSQFHQAVANREQMRDRLFAALAELDQAEMATPLDAGIALKKAGIQRRLGRSDRAIAEYRKALKIAPGSALAAEGLRTIESGDERPVFP